VGTPTGINTAQQAACGVGGGIYITNGNEGDLSTITMSSSKVGIYGNEADYAAADVYTSGTKTALTVPPVNGMVLTNYPGVATGWYADYNEVENAYPSELGTENPGRYVSGELDNVDVQPTQLNQTKLYLCLTLGASYQNLIIEKQLKNEDGTDYVASENLGFIFEVTGVKNNSQVYTNTVVVMVPQGESKGSVFIADLPDGTYTVKEDTDWSWQFAAVEPEKTVVVEKDRGDTLYFTNRMKSTQWFSGESWCQNIFLKDTIKQIVGASK